MPEPSKEDRQGDISDNSLTGRTGIMGIDRELVGLRKDGGDFPMEVVVSEIELDGQLSFTAIVRDISERKRADAGRAAAMNEWTRTFDEMEAAVLVLDGDGGVLRLNRAAAMAAARDFKECLSLKVGELAPGDPWQTAADLAGAGPAGELRVRDEATGSWWDVSVAPLSAGSESRAIVTARDVTRTVELEVLVRRSEQMVAMGSLVAGVAHEVRNPLFAMSVNIDALGEELKGKHDVEELLTALREERDRMNALMVDLLEYGKPTPPVLKEGRLEPVVEASVRSCQELAASLGVKVDRAGRPCAAVVRMETRRLREVFENVLKNACQHSAEGGCVSVEMRCIQKRGADWAQVEVRDTGPGFPADEISRVFEPFYTRRQGGTGLGLAIAQRVVDEHAGRIRVGNGEQGGAIVTVELPCYGHES